MNNKIPSEEEMEEEKPGEGKPRATRRIISSSKPLERSRERTLATTSPTSFQRIRKKLR